jgi:hypothetical protein
MCLAGCPRPTAKGTPPARFCPHGPGCEKGNDGALKVGIASVKITPSFECVRPDFLRRVDLCNETAPTDLGGTKRCGRLVDNAFNEDCGADRKCPGAPGYGNPDADGSERDGKPDFFLDCGRDQRCPGAPGYQGPDADGSEGDGKFQGVWIAGFGNTTPAVDVHDDLFARAIFLENGDISIALVSVDAVGVFRDDVEKVRQRLAKGSLGAPDYVLVSATHTHEGPDTMGQWGPIKSLLPERGVDDGWFDKVFLDGVVKAVNDARGSATAAKVFSAQAKLGEKTRQIIGDTRDPFISDDTVSVLKFTEARGGAVIGTLVSYGNHPETLADVNNSLSADYVWALREGVENGVFKKDGSLVKAGVGGTCVFFAGALGGMMTSLGAKPISVDGDEPPPRTYAKTKAVGDLLAIAALDGLDTAKEEKAPNLAFGATTLKIPVENELFRLMMLPGVDILRRTIYDFERLTPIGPGNEPTLLTEVSKVQLGGVRLLGVPGELLPELAIGFDQTYAFGAPFIEATNPAPPNLANAPPPPYLKQRLGGETPIILGLANDEVGYLVPEYDYVLDSKKPYTAEAPGDHYEETNSLGPKTTPLVLEAFKTLTEWEPVP